VSLEEGARKLEDHSSAPREIKQQLRERIWHLLEQEKVTSFPRPVWGRIPNFLGAQEAALKLLQLPEVADARVVKVNPDSPQIPIRRLLLKSGKKLIMATPRLREGFLLIDPNRIPENRLLSAGTIRGAFSFGRKIEELRDLPKVDFIVEGSVAVNTKGGRIGKGEGYAELEYAILKELELTSEKTKIATTVHDLQIVEEFPLELYDVPVDYIATPTKMVPTNSTYPRPRGILWDLLEEAKVKEIPILAKLRKGVTPSTKGESNGLQAEVRF
jgi:5-formyltetrahydrofolate cyclo-ligase